ncbi:MAG: class I SAM-dependent methyltransferase [Chloroflexi bacterium]|nr:class I SAM-dependent methyltransferase [Chloroflexota bacterium]
METSVTEKLLSLNRQFYQTFALQFSATRQRLQPGVKRLMAGFPTDAYILDLGCGNGELALSLEKSRFQGQYIGCDASPDLLILAKSRLFQVSKASPEQYQFVLLDLSSPKWENSVPQLSYNLVLSFAVLHHLPGRILRRQCLSALHNLLNNQTSAHPFFALSVWQFLNNPRLRSRIQPWNSIGLCDADVETGDYLLDWRHGGYGLRYVHHFNEDELKALAEETGFSVRQTFYADGEGGNLGLYQVWELMRV